MTIDEVQKKKKELIGYLQQYQTAMDRTVQEFEKECGVQVSGVRKTRVYTMGASWPTSIIEDVVVTL